jgi:hypothetical protein
MTNRRSQSPMREHKGEMRREGEEHKGGSKSSKTTDNS